MRHSSSRLLSSFGLLSALVLLLLFVAVSVAPFVSARRTARPPIEGLLPNETKKLSNRQFAAALDRFHSWFAEHYGKKLLVKVAPVKEYRLGVIAQVKLRPGQPYLDVPLKICIDAHTLTEAPETTSPPHFKDYWQWLRQQRDAPTMPVQLLLASFLVHARWVAPNQTFWAPYIDMLPRKMQTPEHSFTEEDMGLLEGLPKVRKAIRGYRAKREAEYNWVRERVAGHAAWGEHVLPKWALNYARWSWAMAILNTRMIWWEGGPHLVPLLDMVNCDPGPKENFAGGRRPHVHETVREGDRAVTRAGWTIQKGDEVMENYGQTNHYYFLNHGFVIDGVNPHDCYHMTLPPMKRDVSKRAMFLVNHHQGGRRWPVEDDELCFSITNPRVFNVAVDVARIYTLPTRVLETAIVKRELPDKDTDKQIRRVLRFLGKALVEKQKQLMRTQNRFDPREPALEDAPHKELVNDFAETMGMPIDDAIVELRKRVRRVTEDIRVRESKMARDKLARQKQAAEDSAKVVDDVGGDGGGGGEDEQEMQPEGGAGGGGGEKPLGSSYGTIPTREKSSKRTNIQPLPVIDDDF